MNTEKKVTIKEKPFNFKHFAIEQEGDVMKVGTDGILLGAWLDTTKAKSILDIGTGTGMIAIMCAQKNQEAKIDAVDIEEAAYRLATHNVKQSPWAKRMEVFHSSVQDFAATTDREYDLIVSNPPFFTGGTFSKNKDRNQMRHTIKLPNGELLQAARRLMSWEGRFCVILPYIEGLRFQEQAAQYGLYCSRQTEVIPTPEKPIERLLMQFERTKKEMETDQLIVEEDRKYTKAFVELTKDFYLGL